MACTAATSLAINAAILRLYLRSQEPVRPGDLAKEA
ncbi:unnamed protein product, partial [marine sediment metagenome]